MIQTKNTLKDNYKNFDCASKRLIKMKFVKDELEFLLFGIELRYIQRIYFNKIINIIFIHKRYSHMDTTNTYVLCNEFVSSLMSNANEEIPKEIHELISNEYESITSKYPFMSWAEVKENLLNMDLCSTTTEQRKSIVKHVFFSFLEWCKDWKVNFA